MIISCIVVFIARSHSSPNDEAISLLSILPRLLPSPPIPKEVHFEYQIRDRVFVDEFHWLENSSDPAVLEYVESENYYTRELLRPFQDLKRVLLDELASWDLRLSAEHAIIEPPIANATVPHCFQFSHTRFLVHRPFIYFPVNNKYYRQRLISSCSCILVAGPLELVLDFSLLNINLASLAVLEVFYSANLSTWDYIAFGVSVPSERFQLQVFDVSSKTLLPFFINNTYYSSRFVKQQDEIFLYYTLVDRFTVPRSIGRVSLQSGTQEMVYTEADQSFTAELLGSPGTVFMKVSGLVSSEFWTLAPLRPLFRRLPDVYYTLQHIPPRHFLRTNWNAPNYQVFSIPDTVMDEYTRTNKVLTLVEFMTQFKPRVVTVFPPSNVVFVQRIIGFDHHVLMWALRAGRREIHVHHLPSSKLSVATSDGSMLPGWVDSIDGRLLYDFQGSCMATKNGSLSTLPRLWNLEFEQNDLKFTELGGWNPQQEFWNSVFHSKFDVTWENSGVPMHIVSHAGAKFARPTLLKAYGAYGTVIAPMFDSNILPLLDRGWNYVVCHPRGDGDLGSTWWEQGKLGSKANTLKDVDECIQRIVQLGLSTMDKIVLYGRSAGGLIPAFGSIKWPLGAVIIEVGFLDVVGDAIKTEVAWKEYEWAEWGNPEQNETILSHMLEYSPYHLIGNNSTAGNLSPLMVLTGFQDKRVHFTEPTKFVARLRTKAAVQVHVVYADGVADSLHNSQRLVSRKRKKKKKKKVRPEEACTNITVVPISTSAGKKIKVETTVTFTGNPILLHVSDTGHFSGRLEMVEWYTFVIAVVGYG